MRNILFLILFIPILVWGIKHDENKRLERRAAQEELVRQEQEAQKRYKENHILLEAYSLKDLRRQIREWEKKGYKVAGPAEHNYEYTGKFYRSHYEQAMEREDNSN